MKSMIYVDSREQDFIDRFKKYYPEAETDALPVGDIWNGVYVIERKKGKDLLNYEQIAHELINMAKYRGDSKTIQLHLCAYGNYNEKKRYSNHNRKITQKEKNFITSLCFKTGVYFHFDENEEKFFERVDKIFSGKQDIIYYKTPRIRELTTWENMIAVNPGFSPQDAIVYCQTHQYPAQLSEDSMLIDYACEDALGSTINNEPLKAEKEFKKMWYGGDN